MLLDKQAAVASLRTVEYLLKTNMAEGAALSETGHKCPCARFSLCWQRSLSTLTKHVRVRIIVHVLGVNWGLCSGVPVVICNQRSVVVPPSVKSFPNLNHHRATCVPGPLQWRLCRKRKRGVTSAYLLYSEYPTTYFVTKLIYHKEKYLMRKIFLLLLPSLFDCKKRVHKNFVRVNALTVSIHVTKTSITLIRKRGTGIWNSSEKIGNINM